MNLIKLQKKIVPEMLDILELRYDILRSIDFSQPIGRRNLSEKLNIKERTIRNEVNILKDLGLLNVESMGMYITGEGKVLIEELKEVIYNLRGITQLEKQLQKALNLKKVIIVPSNFIDKSINLKDMGKISSKYLKEIIEDNFIVGITGGTTMAALAREMKKEKVADNVLVIPARGGLGKDVETQSNSVAANLAKKLEGSYKLLHIPDSMDTTTLNAVLNLPNVNEIIQLIKKMNVLVFGIGRADTMAERRNLPKEKIEELLNMGAVAEAFGHYFDVKGNEFWEYKTVGLSLEKFKKLDKVIGVAGEEEKAEAIMAVAKLKSDMVLITDELAARKILKLESNKIKQF